MEKCILKITINHYDGEEVWLLVDDKDKDKILNVIKQAHNEYSYGNNTINVDGQEVLLRDYFDDLKDYWEYKLDNLGLDFKYIEWDDELTL